MTQLLETALAKVQQLTAPEQDAIAQRILDELAGEQKWDEGFARSQNALGRRLAKYAKTSRRAKRDGSEWTICDFATVA